jgi:hypothetical protein
MRFFATMLLVLLPLSAQQAPKNLKVLTPQDIQGGIMRTYVTALGAPGGCNFCHAPAPAGKDSDANPKKDIARMMITMVKDINSKIATGTGESGKVFVTCYTCHRGKTEPETAPGAGQP